MPYVVFNTAPRRRQVRKAAAPNAHPLLSLDIDLELGAHPATHGHARGSSWDRAARDEPSGFVTLGRNYGLPDPAVPRSFAVRDRSLNQAHLPGAHLGDRIERAAWESADQSSMSFATLARPADVDDAADAFQPIFAPLTEAALLTHTASSTTDSFTYINNNVTSRFSPSPVAISAFSFSEISSRGVAAVDSDMRVDFEMVHHPSPGQTGSWAGASPAVEAAATHVHRVAAVTTAAPSAPAPAVLPQASAPANDAPVQQHPAEPATELCPLAPWEDPTPKPPVCTPEYKKIAGHLAEWAAEMVMRLVRGPGADAALTAPALDAFGRRKDYGGAPTLLVDNIRYCLMSTLLQPSAVFLAVYYITKLPVFAAAVTQDTAAIQRFRRTLFGDVANEQVGKNDSDLYAPFKVFVNGILLASKTLDDATFSNRVWHDISRIPIQDINALELASLELLAYDLTVPADEWTAWLELLRASHMLRAPFPAPIGPMRETPHGAVLDVFSNLINASTSRPRGAIDGPIFLGLEERIAERLKVLSTWMVVDEDLDEDGPLRDEYRPRAQSDSRQRPTVIYRAPPVDLPPPAEWFPAADPIVSRPQRSSHVGWPPAPSMHEQPPVYHPAVSVAYPIPVMDSYGYVAVGHPHHGVTYMNPHQLAYHQPSYYRTCCA